MFTLPQASFEILYSDEEKQRGLDFVNRIKSPPNTPASASIWQQ